MDWGLFVWNIFRFVSTVSCLLWLAESKSILAAIALASWLAQ